MDRFLVHKHQQDFTAAIRRLEADGAVIKENKALILSFSKVRMAKGTSKMRTVKCVYCLRMLARAMSFRSNSAKSGSLIISFNDFAKTA